MVKEIENAKPGDIAVEGDVGPAAAVGQGASVQTGDVAGRDLIQMVQQLPPGMEILGRMLVEVSRNAEAARTAAEKATVAWEADKGQVEAFELYVRQVEDRMDRMDDKLHGNDGPGISDQIRELREEMKRTNAIVDDKLSGFSLERVALTSRQETHTKDVETRQEVYTIAIEARLGRLEWKLNLMGMAMALAFSVPIAIIALRALGFL